MNNGNHHYQTVAAAIQYITAHQSHQPTLDEISDHVHLSKFHLQRIFKEWAGVSPKEFLQYLTVEQSKKLLRLGKSTLETTYDVGLSGNGRLHDLFLKYEACTPGEFKKQGEGMQIRWEIIPTPFGEAIIGENDKGVCKLAFTNGPDAALEELDEEYPKAVLTQELGRYGQLLKKYFADWKVPKEKIGIYFRGTPFQIQVWRALVQIPYGQLRTYQDVSTAIGKPGAVRAVGTAIGKNPIAYLIPCHRVIRSDGMMGGYRWQPERKMIINAFEQAQFQD
ncbi:MAG: methylated-DNA--[protein]-cysteine S-methyltransferase [Saprospiraceae bacterium]|nr:methylated-DNA--[protein]-cysteine S-methyltransferase [Lewinella sp.]